MAHHVYEPIKKVRIDLYLEDNCVRLNKSFDTLQQFADYLREQPKIAEALGHKLKPKA